MYQITYKVYNLHCRHACYYVLLFVTVWTVAPQAHLFI